MTSWKLFRRVFAHQSRALTPVFMRDITPLPDEPKPLLRTERQKWAVIIGSGLAYVFFCGIAAPVLGLLASILMPLMMLSVPLLLPLLFPLWIALTLAPSIVEERERRTWDLLRVTPLGTDTILLSKAAAALWRRGQMVSLTRAFLTVVAGVIAMGVVYAASLPESALGDLPREIVLVAAVVAGGVFVLDRVQQYMLMLVATLVVSTASTSARAARLSAGVVIVVLWLVDMGVAWLVLVTRPGYDATYTWLRLLTLPILGPTVPYLIEMPLLTALAAIAVTLAVREIAVYGLWLWALYAAKQS
ncbi:MAG: hypothetical protein JXJ20_00660 [Anaerolineae bacterium]|nr:hypothetical protein [Anaerolineae bacterium]